MIQPYYFTNRVLKAGIHKNLDSFRVNNKNSKLTITSEFSKTESTCQ